MALMVRSYKGGVNRDNDLSNASRETLLALIEQQHTLIQEAAGPHHPVAAAH